ncbi:hypothetical protein ccbrp13_26300 [Ktedonobacteria bacterium brp13]|nr:hypothetical protein ccbrp13_26300 [Ktedonobacteria bacterium brp13]
MAALELRVDISTLIDAVISGDTDRIISSTRALLAEERNADVLLGRIGAIASKGDPEGNITITVAAAAMLARFLRARPAPLDQEAPSQTRTLPLFVRAMQIAAPAVRIGNTTAITEPPAFFPSELVDKNTSINEVLNEAVNKDDLTLTERILLGFYGTGADYRTLQVRAYETHATNFPREGYPLECAVRGFQLLDAVEWSSHVPTLIHWLAPKLVIAPNETQPAWIEEVRQHAAAHGLTSIRTRLSTPKNANALPVQQIILSNADTKKVLQAVTDAILTGEAAPRAVASIIALAAAEILEKVDEKDHARFLRASNGLLYASAVRNVFRQVQDVEVYNLVYTAAAYINALYKEVAQETQGNAFHTPAATGSTVGGGLIAASQLETLEKQLYAQDYAGALSTANRYLTLGHDARALFGTLGLGAAQNDYTTDQGRSLQLVLAAGEEYTNWPKDLPGHSIQAFLHAALRAATFGTHDNLLAKL